MENRYISLLSDYGFKVVFADETDTLFLRKALKALIQLPYEIKQVQFLRHEFVGLTQRARAGLFDLLCEDELGNTFIVEMQLGHYPNYFHRAKFYAFQRFNTMIEKGDYYFQDLKRIYCIGLLGHNIFPQSELYYHFITSKNQHNEEIDHQITHVIVEFRKFKKQASEIVTDLDKLLYLMKNVHKIKGLDELPEELTDDWVQQALQKVDRSQMTAEQRSFFEMTLARNASIIWMRKYEREQDRKEARAEGRIEGKAEGRIEGKAEGKAETIVEMNLKTAKKMKEEDINLEIIARITGLTIAEIEAL